MKVGKTKGRERLSGIPKLEDANDAGGRYSQECTLILTEGDSAKTSCLAGLSVVGRDRFGVFPLRVRAHEEEEEEEESDRRLSR